MNTEDTPLPDLLENAAKQLRDDPTLSLNWDCYDGAFPVVAAPAGEQVAVRISEKMWLRMEPEMAARLSTQLAWAAMEVHVRAQRAAEPLTCEDCGEKKEDVTEVDCPYRKELYGESVPATLCHGCYRERAAET
jgi:hypothetical protein